MKANIGIFFSIIAILFISSCDSKDQISYDKAIKNERKTIQKFITDSGFELLTKYPSGGFEKNQFVQLKNGAYICVIDSGNGNRAELGKTKVLVRVRGNEMNKVTADSITFDYFLNGYDPYQFTYGGAENYAYSNKNSSSINPQILSLGKGLESALEHVGENGEVRMIVPFDLGSAYQMNRYVPLYFDRIKFMFSIYE